METAAAKNPPAHHAAPPAKKLVPSGKFLLRLALGAFVLSALAGIYAVLAGGFGSVSSQVFNTAGAVIGTALVSLCFTGTTASRWFARLQVFGVASALVTVFYGVFLIWENYGDISVSWPDKVFATAAILAIANAQACILLPMRNTGRRIKRLAFATLAAILIFSGLVIFLILGPLFTFSDWYIKLIAIFLILDILGTVLLPVLRYFGTHIARPEPRAVH